MGTDTGRVDRHQTRRPRITDGRLGADRVEHRPVRPIQRPALVTFPHRLPSPELLGQVTPRRAGTEPPRNGFQSLAMIVPGTPAPPSPARQNRLDDSPQRIRDHARSKHAPIITRPPPKIWQTRSDM